LPSWPVRPAGLRFTAARGRQHLPGPGRPTAAAPDQQDQSFATIPRRPRRGRRAPRSEGPQSALNRSSISPNWSTGVDAKRLPSARTRRQTRWHRGDHVAGMPMPWPVRHWKANEPVVAASTTVAHPRRAATSSIQLQAAREGLRKANAHRRASNRALAVVGKVKGLQEVSCAVAWVFATQCHHNT
jgi:hypothetical protein